MIGGPPIGLISYAEREHCRGVQRLPSAGEYIESIERICAGDGAAGLPNRLVLYRGYEVMTVNRGPQAPRFVDMALLLLA